MGLKAADFSVVHKRLQEIKAKYADVSVEAGLLAGGKTADNPRTDRTIEEIAEYAHRNEYGEGVPERPFMRRAVEARSEQWGRTVGEYLARGAGLEQAFENAGALMRDDIRRSIEGEFGEWRPNSPRTVENKTRISVENGEFVGTETPSPLIDTGAMHRSIGYKITKGKAQDE